MSCPNVLTVSAGFSARQYAVMSVWDFFWFIRAEVSKFRIELYGEDPAAEGVWHLLRVQFESRVASNSLMSIVPHWRFLRCKVKVVTLCVTCEESAGVWSEPFEYD